ncbi:hypothetical protein ACFWAY_25085 [Rhodococcus sp. NPDC059968]|uniref:hypothetical protein n=1 Tax=Rhodococcus sp. NPDC059968 TaxID=3347017 RepID=UPI00366E5CFF
MGGAIAHHHHRIGHESSTGQEIVRALSGIQRDYAAVGDRRRIARAALLSTDIVTITVVSIALRQQSTLGS